MTVTDAPLAEPVPSLSANDGDEAIPQVIRDVMCGPIVVAAGAANVIMQLSRLPVGRGVAGSKVDSGRVDKHPVKRFRTTFTYLIVAMVGTDVERLALRREVNRSHRQVRSGPEDPVAYNAFDPALQLWVAACLYRGVELSYRLLYGIPDESTAEVLYRHSGRFATTLQVPAERWPSDREAFEEYWSTSLSTVKMDDVTRAYLRGIATVGFLPVPFRWLLGPMHLFLTAGFLTEPFRSELGLSWGAGRQQAFEVLTSTGAWTAKRLPGLMRAFPFNLTSGTSDAASTPGSRLSNQHVGVRPVRPAPRRWRKRSQRVGT